MNREEILNYLMTKRRLTAPATNAETELNNAKEHYEVASNKYIKALMWLVGLTLLFAFLTYKEKDFRLYYHTKLGVLQFTTFTFTLIFGLVTTLIYFYRKNSIVQPAEQWLAESQEAYNIEVSKQAYIDGKKGFPAKFYNHHDCYRLYKLIEEHRADDLKEAFNLLESQHFNEAMLSMQDEMLALQQDVAASARMAATSSAVAAAASVAAAANAADSNRVLHNIDNQLNGR